MIKQRKPLSAADTQAKARILSLLKGEKSGVLFAMPDFVISYNNTSNIFQVDLRTVNVMQTKQDAVRWFKQQGWSDEAICNYPVMFYPSWEIVQELGKKDYIFTTLSPTCFTTNDGNISLPCLPDRRNSRASWRGFFVSWRKSCCENKTRTQPESTGAARIRGICLIERDVTLRLTP